MFEVLTVLNIVQVLQEVGRRNRQLGVLISNFRFVVSIECERPLREGSKSGKFALLQRGCGLRLGIAWIDCVDIRIAVRLSRKDVANRRRRRFLKGLILEF